MELDNDTLRRKELNIVVSQLSIDTMNKVKKFWIIDLMDIMDEG